MANEKGRRVRISAGSVSFFLHKLCLEKMSITPTSVLNYMAKLGSLDLVSNQSGKKPTLNSKAYVALV